ncbi:polyketide cyclase [Rhodanobacter hydrolyticus]|uniref:Polyketide cyclase n=2 Tax=Rhodanobacteraceae TaxID=1775411 RepID=A0ABW8J6I9_9GAMM|nr:polyketide cyclase [Rhodanobacter sp. 7MK24]
MRVRVLEFLAACAIVVGIGVVAAVVMPGSGHIERSLVVGKDMRQVYDVVDNLRRLPEFSVLTSRDPQIKYTYSGKAFGPGAEVSWASGEPAIGNGSLTIDSATPDFNKVDGTAKTAQVVWDIDNGWKGYDKTFTFALERQGNRNQLTNITWSYDVKYGWNLVNRFANLYIHGDPDSFIEFGLNNLQNVLAAVPNVSYGDLVPYIRQTEQAPVLLVSTSIQRKDGIDGLNDTINKSVAQILATAKKLGVNVTGPRIIFTTNYGDTTYTFDVAMPIDSSSVNVNGQAQQLTAPTTPALDPNAPADASTAAAPAAPALNPGDHDKYGRLVVDGDVRATLAFGGAALEGVWNGTAAGVPQTRDELKAYALTHGYKYDDVLNRSYDILAKPEVKDAQGNITSYAEFDVYLPLSNAPDQTPEQAAGMKQPTLDVAPASAGTAPTPAGTAAAPAASN